MLQRIFAFALPLCLVACNLFEDGSYTSDAAYRPSGYYGPDDGSKPYPGAPSRLADPTVSPPDAGAPDARPKVDGGGSDAAPVVYPPIDATVGEPDRAGCPADAPRLGYLMSDTSVLSRFDPATFTTTLVGTPACPIEAGSSPWVMAATRSGKLYVLYSDCNIYAIDATSLDCVLTPWTPGQAGLAPHVAIAVQRSDGAEALSVLGVPSGGLGGFLPRLGRADLATMTLSVVGPTPMIDDAPFELQGDVYNRLFHFGPTGVVTRLDPATAAVLGVDSIPGYSLQNVGGGTAMVVGQSAYAFATRPNDATVYRYDLVSKKTTAVVQLAGNVSVATASPCSP